MAVIRLTKSGKAFHIVTDSDSKNSYTVAVSALRKLLDSRSGSPRVIVLSRLGMDVVPGKFPESPVFGLEVPVSSRYDDGLSSKADSLANRSKAAAVPKNMDVIL